MRQRFLKGLLGLSLTALLALPAAAQTLYKAQTAKSPDGKYSYEYVDNDPLKARIYTLPNGLRVYMTVNKNAPRIQTYIAVKAGSKNDPSDATGLAHYLEHMLFKGTDKFGSLDYAKEKVELDKIQELYEVYRKANGVKGSREKIYHQIDSISGVAAKYAIANEYDKMMAVLGAEGTNAYTSFEQTVYVNDVPSNQLEKWLMVESERFRNPVMRLFHTELEAVYEEKNISLDNDGRASSEALFDALFPTHNYGQQTTIGTVEHLKNPSIVKIMDYYRQYYVPNNMALCLSGDLDPDKTIALVDKYFGFYQRKEVKPWVPTVEAPLTSVKEMEVFGPNAENVVMAYRFPASSSREARVLQMMDMILSNSAAGLIDLNLNQQQKVLSAYSYTYLLNDYSIHFLGGTPREGQTLEEVKALLLEQIEKLKKGEFDDALLPAILNDFEIQRMHVFETNDGRADAFVTAFTGNQSWASYLSELEELRTVTREEVIATANKYYGNNYVVVYKRTGERKDVVKVVKPAITPVEVNREAESPFLKNIVGTPTAAIEPRFLDFKKDIAFATLKNGVKVHHVKNEENGLFTLYYLLDMGRLQDKQLDLAVRYLPYLGTDKYTAEEIQKKMYALGCSFDVFVGTDQVYVYLSGLQKNFTEGVQLFEHLLANCKADEEALANLLDGELKSREDAKLNKGTILRGGMRSYGVYGAKNPFNHVLTNDELKAVKSKDLVDRLHGLTGWQHRVLYYGPATADQVATILNAEHKAPATLKPVPPLPSFPFADNPKTTVYFVEYNMVQAEVMWLSKSKPYDPALEPIISMYNQYYGGNMSSIVFQTIRESKALAYSTNSRFGVPSRKEDPFMLSAYVGTQADKLHEAMDGMFELLHTMPKSDPLFQTGKDGLLNSMRTERITRTDILFAYERALKMGQTTDIRQAIFDGTAKFTLDDVAKFHASFISPQQYSIMILGSKSKIDLKSLEKYGNVVELSLEQVFGY